MALVATGPKLAGPALKFTVDDERFNAYALSWPAHWVRSSYSGLPWASVDHEAGCQVTSGQCEISTTLDYVTARTR